METLITGANGFIGSYLCEKFPDAKKLTHKDCDLANWREVEKFNWEGEVIINCANYGTYGEENANGVEINIRMLENLRKRWPNSKIISFGSGAMYDKSKPIIKASEYDLVSNPKDSYGLSKKMTVDMSDVTLIIFGLFAKTRFVKAVLESIKENKPVEIFQDAKFSWVNLSDFEKIINWAIKKGSGRYNLCGYDMLLSDVAKKLGAIKIKYLKKGMAFEYTGKESQIKLSRCPSF